MTTLWGGRFDEGLAPEMLALSRSTHFDVRLAEHDCRVLGAHAGVLADAGVLTSAEAHDVRNALVTVGYRIAHGEIPSLPEDEDVHSLVERVLLERLPAVASKLRAGLSRNDRVVTAFRLWVCEAAAQVVRDLRGLVEALAVRAREHQSTHMPGYTHLQRAQPVTLGLVLSAHAAAVIRDARRIHAAIEESQAALPLGAGALAGTTLPLDASRAVRELRFDALSANPIDAVSARDFALQALSAFAICGVHLSRLAEEIVLWTSSEFAFATLSDAYATGSSLMPQKKNPDVAELTRGKTGRLIGNLTTLLVACKGLPLAYNRDLQEDKEPLFDSADTLGLILPALTGAVATMRFDTGRLAAAAGDPLLLATDLAERLVAEGVPFREAHEAVGRAVLDATERDLSWRGFTDADWTKAHPLLATIAPGALDVSASIAARFADGESALTPIEQWLAEHPA